MQYKFTNVHTLTVKKDTVIRYGAGLNPILSKTAKEYSSPVDE